MIMQLVHHLGRQITDLDRNKNNLIQNKANSYKEDFKRKIMLILNILIICCSQLLANQIAFKGEAISL